MHHINLDPLNFLEQDGCPVCMFVIQQSRYWWCSHKLISQQVTPQLEESLCKQRITFGRESHGLETKGEG